MARLWKAKNEKEFDNSSPTMSLTITLKGRIHCENFLSEYFMKY